MKLVTTKTQANEMQYAHRYYRANLPYQTPEQRELQQSVDDALNLALVGMNQASSANWENLCEIPLSPAQWRSLRDAVLMQIRRHSISTSSDPYERVSLAAMQANSLAIIALLDESALAVAVEEADVLAEAEIPSP